MVVSGQAEVREEAEVSEEHCPFLKVESVALLLTAVAPAETLNRDQGAVLDVRCHMTQPWKAAGPHVFSR